MHQKFECINHFTKFISNVNIRYWYLVGFKTRKGRQEVKKKRNIKVQYTISYPNKEWETPTFVQELLLHNQQPDKNNKFLQKSDNKINKNA